jgi:hypothetical protein
MLSLRRGNGFFESGDCGGGVAGEDIKLNRVFVNRASQAQILSTGFVVVEKLPE